MQCKSCFHPRCFFFVFIGFRDVCRTLCVFPLKPRHRMTHRKTRAMTSNAAGPPARGHQGGRGWITRFRAAADRVDSRREAGVEDAATEHPLTADSDKYHIPQISPSRPAERGIRGWRCTAASHATGRVTQPSTTTLTQRD